MLTSSQVLPCEVLSARMGPDRSHQLVGYGGRDKLIYVYPFSEYSTTARLEGINDMVTALAFNADQTSIAGGSDGGCVRLWDIGSERMTQRFNKGHNSTVTDVQVHKTGQFVATVSTDKNLRIWDVRKSTGVQSYKNAGTALCAVDFSPNGKWVATGCSKGVVRLYNLTTAKMEASLELHTSAITSISFHPELYFVSVGSADGTFSIWNLETFQPQFHSKNFNTPIDSVQFCGNRIVAAADHTLHAYELKHLSEDGLTTIRTPWTLVSDIVFASFADELWFVETSGTTAMTGKLGFSTPTVAPPVVEHKTVRSNPVPQARPREQAPVVKRPPVDTRRDTPEIPRTTSVDVNAAANDGVLTINMHVSEAQVADQLVLTSAKVNAVLHSRLTNLKAVYALWAQDPKSALAHLERSCEEGTDAGAILDFLMAIQQPHMREKFPSEAYPNLLNVIVFALCATEDNVVRASLQAFDCINRQYRARLGEARRRAKASMSNGHNNPLDATVNANIQQKINECYEIAVCLADRNDEIGVVAKEIISSLE